LKKGNLRWWFAFLFFIIGLVAYMDRSNIAVVATPMMNDFHINKVKFGLLNSLFSLGYAVANLPAGALAEKFGARYIVGFAMLWWSIFTMLTAAVRGYGLLAAVRLLFGVGEGPMYPGNSVFNTYWFRNNEKARASGALLAGSYFGPVIGPIITVAIYHAWGWHAVFYLFGVVGLIVAVIWFLLGRNKPEDHPSIKLEELAYIQEGRSVQTESKKAAPWGKLLKNLRFWLFALQYFVTIYVVTMFLVWLPTYLHEAHHLSVATSGIEAASPWLAIFFVVLFGGAISDRMIRAGKSRMKARGGLAIGGFIVFSIAVFLAAHTTSTVVNVFWLTISLGALGLPVVTSWATALDLGNQYSGSVSGWMNFWGNVGAFLSPLVCGWLAQTAGWDAALLINIVPVLIAIVMWFGVRPDKPLLEQPRGKTGAVPKAFDV
jgi:ACS family glucarate transporter-like MFS transporter